MGDNMKYILITIIVLIAIIFFFLFLPPAIYPFKCIAFSEYNLLKKTGNIKFNIAQDLRFYNEQNGLLDLRGEVEDEFGGKYILERKITLTSGKRIDNDTLEYKFLKVEKGKVDDTSEELYEILISEFTSSKESLQLDLLQLRPNVWVIRTSTSFLMACYTY